MRSEIIHQISWTTYQNTVSIVLFKQTESSAFTKIKVIARVSNNVLMGHLVSSQIHNKGVSPWARQEFGTTQRDKGSYGFCDRSVYVDNEMR